MSERKKVLVIQAISDVAMQLFDSRPDIEVEVLTDTSPAAMAARVGDADAITLRDARFPAEVLALAPKLKIISRHGVGYDNLPMAECTARKIPVTIVGDVNAVSVAEHALYLMMAAAKNGCQFDRAVRAGDFAIRGRKLGVELRGKMLLLVGYGRIGQEFAQRARGLGMTIAAVDPRAERTRFSDVKFFDSLEAGLAEADVVSLHTPLTDATRNMIDAAALAHMKPRAILINTARGGIIDEPALVKALEAGRLHGAGLDVFLREPVPAGDPLLGRDDIVLSPHNAALTAECMIEMGRMTVRNVLAALDGTLDETLVVNRAALS